MLWRLANLHPAYFSNLPFSAQKIHPPQELTEFAHLPVPTVRHQEANGSPAFAPKRIRAAGPLAMTQSNFNHVSFKLCKTLTADIPVYDWTLIQSFCLISLSVLRKKEGKGEGRTGLK